MLKEERTNIRCPHCHSQIPAKHKHPVEAAQVIDTDIYGMRLHVSKDISPYINVIRVPGGWIYRVLEPTLTGKAAVSATFVPWSDEWK